jgi:alpha-tubulin suppressor-like RCC1 family protein
VKKIVLGTIVLALLAAAGAAYAYISPAHSKGEPLRAIAVSSGMTHSCAITVNGGAVCWGDNDVGQLGDGTLVSRGPGAQVSGLNIGVTDLSVGMSFSCAVQFGAAKCWGSNQFGSLGDGTEIDNSKPVQVHGLESGVTAIAADGSGACAVHNGGIKCWGISVLHSPVPVQVSGLGSEIVDVGVGDRHACALTADGEVGCWGDNEYGQLGDGSETARDYPAKVVGLPDIIHSISASENSTCAVTARGAAFCWGDNSIGQLGDGTAENRAVPVAVLGLESGASSLSISGSMGIYHTCAVINAEAARNGTVVCWGVNSLGEFGNGTEAGSFIPVPSNWSAISVSSAPLGTCAVVRELVTKEPRRWDNFVRCWGNDRDGQLVTVQ